MSKKNLLKEGTIRRFMELAGTKVIASDFLAEQMGGAPEEDVEDVGMEMDVDVEDDPDAPGFEDVDIEVEADVEELPPEDEGPGAEEEGEAHELATELFDLLADWFEDHGVEVRVEEEGVADVVDVAAAEEEDVALEDEGAEEVEDVDVEDVEDVDVEGEEEMVAEALRRVKYIDNDRLAKQVYSRVAKRLMKEVRTDDVASRLADRIARRLNQRTRSRRRR